MRNPNSLIRWSFVPAAVLLSVACATENTTQQTANGDVLMGMTITTNSDEARNQFLTGMDEADLFRPQARDAFAAAVAADSTFALGYLELAVNGNSLDEFKTNFAKAEALAAGASQAEQLMISAVHKSFVGDAQGQLADYQQLTQVAPSSPRAWLLLGSQQESLKQIPEARASMSKAIELEPTMVGAELALANSFLFDEPKDFAMAETHANRAVELRPDSPTPYDILGDAHRAQGKLEAARDDYTMSASHAPTEASPIQQRGHVNSFLGDYAAARADYEQSEQLGRDNERPTYAMYHAFVNLHEGNPQAAVTELDSLIRSVDSMNIPEPTGVKITLLANEIDIALHTAMLDKAKQLVPQYTELLNAQSTQIGDPMARRFNDITIALTEGRLAAAQKDFKTANAKATAISSIAEPLTNPRKAEPVHYLLGVIALGQNKPADAVTELRQADQTDTYVRYLLAKALEGAGKTDEAKAIYTEVANNNFNSVAFALVRKEAKAKAGM
jgi:tetratricopeptide (TPR) repeat protein